jgi:hypothetical protein
MKSKKILLVVLCLILVMLMLAACAPSVISGEPFATITPDQQLLTGIVGVALSLLFSYFPPVANWFNQKVSADGQRLIMLCLLLVTAVAIYALGCVGILGGVECSQVGAYSMIKLFALAAFANQTTDRLSPKTGSKAPKQPAG